VRSDCGATASGRVTKITIRNGKYYIERMRRISRFVIAGLVVIIPVLFWVSKRQAPARAEQKAVPGSLVLACVARPRGGQGETISLGAGATASSKAVLVTDGQKVTEGTILAVLSCDDRKPKLTGRERKRRRAAVTNPPSAGPSRRGTTGSCAEYGRGSGSIESNAGTP